MSALRIGTWIKCFGEPGVHRVSVIDGTTVYVQGDVFCAGQYRRASRREKLAHARWLESEADRLLERGMPRLAKQVARLRLDLLNGVISEHR